MTSPQPKRDIREQFDIATGLKRAEPEPDENLGPGEDFPKGPYVHVAEYIPVRQWGQVFPCMKLSMGIYRHARDCEGFLAGGIRAKWWRRQFWSYTVWADRDSMLRFVHSGPHGRVIPMISGLAAPGACYVEWISMSPPDWEEAMQRLSTPTRYFAPPTLR